MFSRRAEWNPAVNRLTAVRRQLADEGRQVLDLTVSNPTKAAIDYPLDELSEVMSRAARAAYDPEPLGLMSAREAVAQTLSCDAADVMITASTSEAYSYLFKLLADPGDAIATAVPSYPLLEHLAALELLELQSYTLEYHRRWELDAHRLREAVTPRTRAIVVVNPNNPTGSYVTPSEQEVLARIGLPVISDEVFFDYTLSNITPSSVAGAFVLGGLSKSAGLPHYKLGWIRVPDRKALGALELIADNFLSVSTPVQVALPDLIRIGVRIRDAIRVRTKSNLQTLMSEISGAASVLPVEGGWSAVIRVPRTMSDEELAIHLLQEESVAVHPGYFFDFPTDGFIVVSLLTPPDVFVEGIRRIQRSLPS